MNDLTPGTAVDRYTVVRKLGEGGMAAVYEVQHTTLDTRHALKVLTVGGQRLKGRLVNEGKVQASLQHPNIVAVRDVLEVDGAPALLMDFVDGPDLETWLNTHDPNPDQAETLFRQVVDAVSAAHASGLVHRDLKPANVLMHQAPDGTWQPKVADFGLAKALADDAPSLAKTRQGATMGTPSYMAPEQIRDASTVDHRADVWALGCLLYELTTGRIAFQGADIVDVFNAVTTATYTDSSSLAPEAPARIHQTIVRCLRPSLEDRIADCSSLLQSLDDGDLPPPSSTLTWDEEQLSPAAAAPSAPAAKTPMGWTIPLIGALVLGGGSLVAVVAFVGLFVASGITLSKPCGVADGERAGFIKVPAVFLKRTGATWVLPTEKQVFQHPPREATDWKPGPLTCTLPEGTRLTLVDDPTRAGRAGSWIQVRGGQIHLPDRASESDEP